MKDIIYLPTPCRDWAFQPSRHRNPPPPDVAPEIDSEFRRDLARKIRARRAVNLALGIALYEAATGTRPVIAPPKRRVQALTPAPVCDLLD